MHPHQFAAKCRNAATINRINHRPDGPICRQLKADIDRFNPDVLRSPWLISVQLAGKLEEQVEKLPDKNDSRFRIEPRPDRSVGSRTASSPWYLSELRGLLTGPDYAHNSVAAMDL